MDMSGSGAPRAVAIVLKGYPRLSETFIAQEILGLKQLGLKIRLVALRHPTDDREHPIHREIAETASYLPEYLKDEPLRVLNAWWRVRRRPGYRAARRAFLKDLVRDRTANRIRRFGQALVLAAEMPADVGHIYVHFLHTPGSVARYAARILGLPWSVSAHAKDIWTIPDWEKREKLADCAWAVTCTRANVEHLRSLAPQPERVALAYHGLDLGRFPAPGAEAARTPAGPVRMLSVGRLVDKKGHAGLIEALALLPPERSWTLDIVGGGPDKAALADRVKALGLSDRVTFSGALAQAEVLARYRAADLFVLNCRVSDDGDRDGLPNVLMEAQSQGLPCVSTAVSAIPEFILDGVTGLLVSPDDPPALAAALTRLIDEPELRRSLGEAGRRRVSESFGHWPAIRDVHRRLMESIGSPVP